MAKAKKIRKDYREPAQELCRQAGLDPFELVERPGLPSAPRWLAYLSQAQDADKPASIPPMIQPDEYKNAPLTIIGSHEQNTLDQMATCMNVGNVVAGVICADGHLGYAMPVGGVIAYEKQISISGIGFDQHCGNLAVRLDTKYSDIKNDLNKIIKDISKNISFGVGRTNNTKVPDDLFDDTEAWRACDMEEYRKKAKNQLGTVGSGNHYVDVFREVIPGVDEDSSPIWIGVHFGSRGFGHTATTKFLKMAGGQDGINVPPAVVDEDSDIGVQYLAGLGLTSKYAYAGRDWVADTVASIIGGTIDKRVHNHHNAAFRENHFGKDLWVVRKGATPAFPGQEGFVGGSMGDDAVIVEGIDSEKSKNQLYSTVHGAGRLFGRKHAIRTFTRAEMEQWLNNKGVLLAGAGVDESPMAYRRLNDVLAEHSGTIKVNHTLRPILVVMAGEGEYDPWKD